VLWDYEAERTCTGTLWAGMGGTRIFDVGGQRGGKAKGMGATENRHCRTLNRVQPSYANRELSY